MAASTKGKNVEGKKLFTNDDGSPLIFFMRPCAERQRLRPSINEHGGRVTSNQVTVDCIRIAEKGSLVSGEGFLSSKYVEECIKENKLLGEDDFRIRPGTMAPNNSTSDNSDSDMSLSPADCIEKHKPIDLKGRTKYTKEEDIAIMRFLVTENMYRYTSGSKIWKDMERMQVTDHSWQSMNTRYRKVILPSIQSYVGDIPKQWVSKLTGVISQKENTSFSVDDLFKRKNLEKKTSQKSHLIKDTVTTNQDTRPSQRYQQLEFVAKQDKAKHSGDNVTPNINKKSSEKVSSYFSKENAKGVDTASREKETSQYFSKEKARLKDANITTEVKRFSPLRKTDSVGNDHRQTRNDIEKEGDNENATAIIDDASVVESDKSATELNTIETQPVTRSTKDAHSDTDSVTKVSSTIDDKDLPAQKNSIGCKSPNEDKVDKSTNASILKRIDSKDLPAQNNNIKCKSPNKDKGDKSTAAGIGKRRLLCTDLRQEENMNSKECLKKARNDLLNDSNSDIFELDDDVVEVTITGDNSQDVWKHLEPSDDSADNIIQDMSQSLLAKNMGPVTSTPKVVKRTAKKSPEVINSIEECKAICKEVATRYDLKYETVRSLLERCNGDVNRVVSYIELGPHSSYPPPWTIEDDHLMEDHRNISALIIQYGLTDVNGRLLFLEGL